MEFEKAMKIWKRMCGQHKSGCDSCALGDASNLCGRPTCGRFLMYDPIKAQKVLEDWDEKNPPRTLLMDFKEKYPNAPLDNGIPRLCPTCLYRGLDKSRGCPMDCVKCWSQSIEDIPEQEAENNVATD